MCQNLDSCILINYNYTLQRVKWIHDSVDNNDSAHLPENLPKNRTEIVASTPTFSFSPFCLPVTLRWISNVCYYVLFPFIFTIPPRCLNPLYGWSTQMYYDSYCCLNRSEYWQWHHRIYSKRLYYFMYTLTTNVPFYMWLHEFHCIHVLRRHKDYLSRVTPCWTII